MHKRERLHRQDREDAGHQVQDQAAQHGEQDRLEERGARGGGGGCCLGDRSAGERQLEGARRRAIARGHDQDAIDCLRRLDLRRIAQAPAGRHAHGEALACSLRQLRGRGLDEAAREGEEEDALRVDAGPRWRLEIKDDRALPQVEAGGERATLQGLGLARAGKGLLPLRIDRRFALDDGQRQLERCILGDTDVLAGKPGGLDPEADRRPGDEARRHGDVDRQQHAVRVAVVCKLAKGNALGVWPVDLARRDALRQGPGQRRGLARFTGVAPIGVPAGLHHLRQAQRNRATCGGHAGALGDEARLEAWRGDNVACGGGRQQRHPCHKTKENPADHAHPLRPSVPGGV